MAVASGWSAVHHAARRNNLKRLELLLRYGADIEARTIKQVRAAFMR